MNFKRVFSFALVFAGAMSWGFAQDKYAYFDEAYVLPLVPEYKAVQTELESFQKQIKAEIDKLEKEYKEKLEALRKMANQPDASEILLESGEKELESLQKRIQTMRQNAQIEGQDKAAKKLDPINQKIEKALQEVAQEQGTPFIFRRETAMFVLEENNVSDLVLKKMGISPTAAVANRGSLKASNKFAFCDANTIVPLLPEFKKLQKDMEVFREFLKKEMEKVQADGQRLMQEIEQIRATATPAQLQPKMDEVQKLENKMMELQQSAPTKTQEKYNKGLEPILKIVQTKVDEIAKEKGYTFIFRAGVANFYPESENITNAILQKFGITPPAKPAATGN